jgi:hypothetical protein
MISLGMANACGTRPQRSSGSREAGRGSQRGAGNFEQNLCSLWQGAAHCDQGAPGTDVESGGKLKEFFSLVVPAADKDRDCEGQSSPLPTFFFGPASNQGLPRHLRFTPSGWHLMGQMNEANPETPWLTPFGGAIEPEMALPAPDCTISRDFLGPFSGNSSSPSVSC